MHVLEKRNILITGMKVLRNVVDESDRNFKIPKRVFHSLLKMAKAVDAQDEAIDIVRICMKVSSGMVFRRLS
jgi:hypothetical protein